jgi:predicted ATPase
MPSLSVPDPQRLPTIETLGQYEAVQLFVDRASSVLPTFNVTAQNAPALAEICIRLEGIPLAIELAASRVKALSVEKILARMEDRLGLLTGGSRTALPRHQTLRAAMEAAEAVCSGNGVPESAVLDLISGLVDKSLVFVEDRGSQQRYGCLVSLSEYAQLRLMESADRQNTLRRRAEFFLEFAEEGERKLQGSGQEVWLDQLEAERENMPWRDSGKCMVTLMRAESGWPKRWKRKVRIHTWLSEQRL